MQGGAKRAALNAFAASAKGASVAFPLPEIPDHSLLRLIGRGAYGEVFMARNAIGTLRAVKVVRRESFQHLDQFEREFNGLLRFEPISRSHDGLVDILQIGRREDAGYFFYVMELADTFDPEGMLVEAPESAYAPRTLRAELHPGGSLAPAEVITIALKLTGALAHLHASGLVHRDIKPSNIIFVQSEPKLADIGLVTAIDDACSLVGTAGYIPPEGPGTPKADLYGLGKVLYEMTFGKDRQEFPQLPPDLESHPDYKALLELNEIILRACETDPVRRYQSAEEMEKDLALLRDGKSVKLARRLEQRLAIAKKISVAAILFLLVAALPLITGSKYQHTPAAEARREYEFGRWHYNQLTPEAHRKALEHLTRAVEIDPRFVLPYRELTALYVWGKPGLFVDEADRMQKVKAIADKLLKLDPELAEGHTALSWLFFLQHDLRGAEEEVVRAIELNPDYPFAHDIYSFYLSMMLRVEEAQQQGQRSQELDPTARTGALVAAWPYFAARQFDKTIAQIERLIELDKNFPEAYNLLGRCYEAQSNYVAAIDSFRSYELMVGSDPVRVDAGFNALRQAYETKGQEGYLRKYIELIREDELLPPAERVFFIQDIAGYYARLGENENALNEIEKQLNDPAVRMQLKFEPLHDTLRDEPRFREFVKKAGLEK
jgi:tetratricopeptide (TPR) repeat protein